MASNGGSRPSGLPLRLMTSLILSDLKRWSCSDGELPRRYGYQEDEGGRRGCGEEVKWKYTSGWLCCFCLGGRSRLVYASSAHTSLRAKPFWAIATCPYQQHFHILTEVITTSICYTVQDIAEMQIKSLVTCILSVVCCYANTEKTIFLAPNSVEIPKLHPNLDSLQLSTITSSNRELRTRIRRKFATSTAQKGLESWYILDYLTPGQRYELRVCWVATVRAPEMCRCLQRG